MRGGAGRTRTNHQSVMEHGWCPTNSPGRTPIRIAGSFAVLLDFPGFLILDQPPECYGTWFESDQLPWSDTLEPTTKVLWNMGVRPAHLVGQPCSPSKSPCAVTASHSALILAARITLPHFSVSSAISLPKSEGDPASTVPPNSARSMTVP